MSSTLSYVANQAGAPFKKNETPLGPLKKGDVEIKVRYCGLCHSDYSMWKDDWKMTTYPFVGGHEIVGEIIDLDESIEHLQKGQKVGLGWVSKSCMHCEQCVRGDSNLCESSEATIVNRPGGFADKVRCHWSWAIPLPDHISLSQAGPLFCGGITVFNPIVQKNISPLHKVGVVGIGGLGHMAIKFLAKWGCHVTAFTQSQNKREWIKKLGAHQIISSVNPKELEKHKNEFDFILVTSNVTLPWDHYINMLAPKGILHFVGLVPESIPTTTVSLIDGQKSLTGTPLGPPFITEQMLNFCVRHNIYPEVEVFPMSKINEAMDHLEANKARFRIVLENDF